MTIKLSFSLKDGSTFTYVDTVSSHRQARSIESKVLKTFSNYKGMTVHD